MNLHLGFTLRSLLSFPGHLRNPPAVLLLLLLLSPLHTRSLSPLKLKPTNWNTNHALVPSNPLLSLLERCISLPQLKQIQAQMTLTGFITDGFASSRLVAFCAISESRDLDYCARVLFSLRNPNVFSWNVAIRGVCESLNPEEAIILYREMLRDGCSRPDNYTYPLLLKVCSSLGLKFVVM